MPSLSSSTCRTGNDCRNRLQEIFFWALFSSWNTFKTRNQPNGELLFQMFVPIHNRWIASEITYCVCRKLARIDGVSFSVARIWIVSFARQSVFHLASRNPFSEKGRDWMKRYGAQIENSTRWIFSVIVHCVDTVHLSDVDANLFYLSLPAGQ